LAAGLRPQKISFCPKNNGFARVWRGCSLSSPLARTPMNIVDNLRQFLQFSGHFVVNFMDRTIIIEMPVDDGVNVLNRVATSSHRNSRVAWVIGAPGGPQLFCRPISPKVVRYLITPIFAAPLDCRPGRSAPSVPVATPLHTQATSLVQ